MTCGVLWKAGFQGEVIDLLLLATTSATLHMGDCDGVVDALACLSANVAQGCPASAMVFGIVAEIHAFLAFMRVP